MWALRQIPAPIDARPGMTSCSRMAHVFAFIGWSGLLAQYVLMLQEAGIAHGGLTVAFSFTILTNVSVALAPDGTRHRAETRLGRE
jgi:hypothetical protein